MPVWPARSVGSSQAVGAGPRVEYRSTVRHEGLGRLAHIRRVLRAEPCRGLIMEG